MNSPEPTESREPVSPAPSASVPPVKVRRVAISLDIGGTKIAAGLVRGDGKILVRRTIPTAADRGGEAVLQDCLDLIGSFQREAVKPDGQPVAIGLGICELVDLAGNIISDQTIKWRGVPVRERLGGELPVFIEADCRAAALCEARLGAGREFPTFLYVTVGTGISCTLVIEGRPYRGARGATGTMATSPLPFLCSECGAISRTSLEQVAGGPGMVARFNALSGGGIDGAQAVVQRATVGEAAARHVVETAAESLGGMIGTLINVLDPHGVVIGGGLGSAPGIFWEAIARAARAAIWSESQRELPIARASFGADAGLVGAALVALEERS